MNHKRGKPKHQRSGCLYCKSHKDEREPKSARIVPNTQRRLQDDDGNCTGDEAAVEVEAEIAEREWEANIEAMEWPFGIADGVVGWQTEW